MRSTRIPANYQQIGTNPAGGRVSRCSLLLQSESLCTPKPDSLRSYNPLEDNSLFVSGWREQFGASVAGGANLLQYFLGGDFSRERGVYVNNLSRRVSVRSNLNAEFTPQLTGAARLGYYSNPAGPPAERQQRPGSTGQRPAGSRPDHVA